MIDHYLTLSIPRDADNTAIVRAWREAASLYHPDRPTGDVEKFRAAREAFNCLMDAQDRAKHDAKLNGAADAGLLSEDDFGEIKAAAAQMARPAQVGCMMCAGSGEVRVAASGFWTRRKCPACVGS
jgi:DnaJ-class molecular chaperone